MTNEETTKNEGDYHFPFLFNNEIGTYVSMLNGFTK